MKQSTSLKREEAGLVSVTVTLIIMIIITLVVSSFALIVRKEQRRSLDRQLSSQAFYAAETGIGDAVHAINNGLTQDISRCSGAGSFEAATNGDYNSNVSSNVSYSCLLINQKPGHVKIDSQLPEDGPTVYPITTDSATEIRKIRISWKERDGNTSFPDTPFQLPNSGLKNPLLRVSIMRGFDGTALTKQAISNRTQTLFLYPSAGSSPGSVPNVTFKGNTAAIATNDPDQGRFVGGNCNTGNNSNADPDTPNYCNVDISVQGIDYYVVVKALYQPANVDIAAYDSFDNALPQVNSQAVIDVTGKAADVLRRVQVRVPVGEGARLRNIGGTLPLGPLAVTNKICKLFEVTDTTVKDNCNPGSPPIPLGNPTIPSGGGTPSGGGSGSGNANIIPPGGGSSSNAYEWGKYFVNDSNNPNSIVASCDWNFGDGSPIEHDACYKGDQQFHLFPVLATPIKVPSDCKTYNVTLTIKFNNGYPDATKSYPQHVPTGSSGLALCQGKYP